MLVYPWLRGVVALAIFPRVMLSLYMGKAIAANIARMARVTINSISVKPNCSEFLSAITTSCPIAAY
jgi:hypothetical protein